MKYFFKLWLLIGLPYSALSQIVTVIDIETKIPIESVALVSEIAKAFATTDALGKVDISAFKESEKILFSHLGYKEAVFSYKQLQLMGFEVQLSSKISALQEVSISANRWQQKKIESPSRITAISMREASFQNPQTTADLLGTSGYAFIQKSQLGGGSPMLRGMAANRILIVLDGVRMNTAIFRSGNLQNVISLDANALESTEILFGPGAVMYGSDAIGGVMNFTTMKPNFSKKINSEPELSGNAMTRFSSANLEKTIHFDFNIGLKKFAFLTNFTFADYNDLRSGSVGGNHSFYRPNYVITYNNKDHMIPNEDSTLQVGSKYSQINFMQKVRYQVFKNLELDYGFHYSETSKFNRYDRLYIMREDGPFKEKLRWAEWYYGPQKWQMHRLGAKFSKGNLLFDNVQFIPAYQFFEESRYDRDFMYKERRMQKENVSAVSVNLDFDKKLMDNITLNYGYEYVYNLVNSVASLTNIVTQKVDSTVTRYPDGSTWQSNGGYATLKYKINTKWILNGGIRFNHFLIKADFDTTFFPFPFTSTIMSSNTTSGSLGVVYSPKENWQIYMNTANGFRAPNIDDMGKVFESVPGYLVVPNPNLKPEKVLNAELGTMKSFGNFITIDATIYQTWLFDVMVRKNFEFNGDTTINFYGNKSRIQAIQNVTQINVLGIQAGIELYYKGLGLRSNISYQNGKEQTSDSLVFYPLRHAAPTFGSTHLTYEYKNKFKVDFYSVYNAKMEYEDLALTERTNPSYARDSKGRAYVEGWYTLNLKLAYFPQPNMAITMGVENIKDIMYRPYSSGINAPGRNFISSLKVKF